MIVSKRRKTSADTVLSSTLTCNKCELCGKLYASKYHLRHYKETSPTPHRRVFTLQHTLNREDKASEGQLLPKRFNLTLGTQRSTNSKLKMAHHESVTFSKYPRPENCIVSSVNG